MAKVICKLEDHLKYANHQNGLDIKYTTIAGNKLFPEVIGTKRQIHLDVGINKTPEPNKALRSKSGPKIKRIFLFIDKLDTK